MALMGNETHPWSLARVGTHPESVVFRLSMRQATRSGLAWGVMFGVVIATSALGYATAYKTLAARKAFALAFSTNAGLNAITGRAIALETVAGYTVWKSLATLSILASVWGLLMGSRLLRGEEESGRFELLLTGLTTKRRATAQILAGTTCGFIVLFAVTALIAISVGRDHTVRIAASSMVFYAFTVVVGGAMFLALGALLSQIAATRRQAAGYSAAILAAAYALRMVADSGSDLGWLRWASPLGWIEELQPLTAPRPIALAPILVCTGAAALLAVYLAGRRDLGASVIPDHSSAPPRTALLTGPLGLSFRLTRGTNSAWLFGIAATALLLGFVAKQAGTSFNNTPSIVSAFHRLGLNASGADSYLGLSSLIVASYIGFLAASATAAMREEEADGLVESFLVRPVARWRWFLDRFALICGVVTAGGLLAGVFTWIGAASTHAGVSVSSLVAAGLNTVPPAICIVGIGVLTMGLAPRATAWVAYGVLIWSFLVKLLGDVLRLSHWVLDTSVLQQMAPAPAVQPDWASAGALVALGLLGVVIGGFAFNHRDLVAR